MIMKKKVIACLCMLLCSSALAGCKIGNTEYVLDTKMPAGREVFSVNGEECGQKEIKLYLSNYRNLYGKEYNVDLWKYDFEGESLEDYVKGSALEEMTRIVCMNIVAEEKELSLSEDEKDKAKKAAKEYYETLSDGDKDYIGASVGDLTDFYEHYAVAEKLYAQLTDGVNIEVSDDEARVMRVQQIIVNDKAVADEVSAHLNSGEDFSAVANTYSEAPVVETNIAREQYPKAVDDVIFEMDNGQTSEMILADSSYYFIKCINKFDQELTEANKDNILIKREKEKFDSVYGDFVNNAQFNLNESVWNSITIKEHSEVTTDKFFEIYDKNFKGE